MQNNAIDMYEVSTDSGLVWMSVLDLIEYAKSTSMHPLSVASQTSLECFVAVLGTRYSY